MSKVDNQCRATVAREEFEKLVPIGMYGIHLAGSPDSEIVDRCAYLLIEIERNGGHTSDADDWQRLYPEITAFDRLKKMMIATIKYDQERESQGME